MIKKSLGQNGKFLPHTKKFQLYFSDISKYQQDNERDITAFSGTNH